MPFSPAAPAQTTPYSHGNPTSYEQFMLEMVNSARSDPDGTAEQLGISLNEGLAPGTITTNSKAPLAFHPLLIDAARGHSDWMLATGIFSHTGVDGTTPSQRAARVGYTNGVAENIGYRPTSGAPDYASLSRDVHEALFKSPGHRENLMNETYSVVGLGLRPGVFKGKNTLMATQNFSAVNTTEDSGPFILGVCYDDADGDNAYDPGEGVGSVRVDTSLGQRHAVTSASGGYAIPLLPVATNTATRDLPFPVDGTPWATVEVYDTQFREEQLAAAASSAVQVVWSAGPLAGPVTNQVVIREPRRVNYTLRGTDGFFYTRTMVTAQSVKKDLRLQDASLPGPTPMPTPTPSPTPAATPSPTPSIKATVKLLPPLRKVSAGKSAKLKVMVTADSMTPQTIPVTFKSSNPAVPDPTPVSVKVPAKRNTKQKAKSGRETVTVRIPPGATGSTTITASVPGDGGADSTLEIKVRRK